MHPLAKRTALHGFGYGTTSGGPAAVVSLDRPGIWNGFREDYETYVMAEAFDAWAKPVRRDDGTIVLVNLECDDEQYLVRASRYALFVLSVGVDSSLLKNDSPPDRTTTYCGGYG